MKKSSLKLLALISLIILLIGLYVGDSFLILQSITLITVSMSGFFWLALQIKPSSDHFNHKFFNI